MEAEIRKEFSQAEIQLIESKGGVFEVMCDGELIFSKKQQGRHPTWEEIRDALRARA